MPYSRYEDFFSRVDLPSANREWPSRRLTEAPLWVPVDLRDGNQALSEPMDPGRKQKFFELMVAMGYKEIEVGYPSASQTDYDFVRLMAEEDVAPDDVTLVVFTPARRDLIERTVESIDGIRNQVVIHMYAATAPIWREIVLRRDRTSLRELIVAGARDVLEFAGSLDNVRFEFSPEVFNLTEPEYALELCNAVTALWDASADRPVILNLPATVEAATPNVYADQIEYMHRNLERRSSVILSVHPHNDRGTGIACAELAVLAGAQRVEGCIFGNGERTGNVDIATLALNLHAQGIDPMIDFSNIDHIRRVVEHSNRIQIHPRHPYVGELVHTAFSGTHQDAIKKGLAEHQDRALATGIPADQLAWRVPYLPVDPADLGRNYEAVIRVNSQSGKGGIAYLLERDYGIEMPRRLQVDFSRRVQNHVDVTGLEVGAEQLLDIFERAYSGPSELALALREVDVSTEDGHDRTRLRLALDGDERDATFTGVGLVEATILLLRDFGLPLEVVSLHQTSLGAGNDGEALTLLEYRRGSETRWAASRHRSVLDATVKAVLAAAIVANGPE
ncbi:2-isopropylmalate synthase [Agreia sp.]|uniref:2-isopropylmalate synthase n=1 Tax=Agreia sp. TaxID=1872416 RepID=UPI0035BC87D3